MLEKNTPHQNVALGCLGGPAYSALAGAASLSKLLNPDLKSRCVPARAQVIVMNSHAPQVLNDFISHLYIKIA